MAQPSKSSSPIAGSVLPIRRAEELLATLPGILAARIVASDTGAIDEIHVLTSAEVTPKQTVRNIESALIAQLGMRVDHRKISVATSLDTPKVGDVPVDVPVQRTADKGTEGTRPTLVTAASPEAPKPLPASQELEIGRPLVFHDVEVARSRVKGMLVRVTLRKAGTSYTGEAEGVESDRSRMELAARATLSAIAASEPGRRPFELNGVRSIEAFDRQFVMVGVTAHMVRESVVLVGTCEVKGSAETAGVLAVLNATNRWLARPKSGREGVANE